jgi:ABC-2 type transport system ATP-binding protein
LEIVGLDDKKDAYVRSLSGGMKRRLLMAKAMVHNPPILVLDEPTAGVDIELRRSMWEFLTEINKNGTTIILTTHYLEEAEQLCRNIAIIDEGCIIENTSMKKLLAELDSQVFILDSADKVGPDLTLDLENVSLLLVDEHSFEVTVSHGRNINDVFLSLDRQHVQVNSMRNKTNRLEQLFLSKLREN